MALKSSGTETGGREDDSSEVFLQHCVWSKSLRQEVFTLIAVALVCDCNIFPLTSSFPSLPTFHACTHTHAQTAFFLILSENCKFCFPNSKLHATVNPGGDLMTFCIVTFGRRKPEFERDHRVCICFHSSIFRSRLWSKSNRKLGCSAIMMLLLNDIKRFVWYLLWYVLTLKFQI